MIRGAVDVAAPGWEVPSIVMARVIAGSAAWRAMVWVPVPMAKSMVSTPVVVSAFAAVIAWRSDPVPESAALVTVKVVSRSRRSRGSSRGRQSRNRAFVRANPVSRPNIVRPLRGASQMLVRPPGSSHDWYQQHRWATNII